MALSGKEQKFLLDLLKGMLSLVTVGRENKAVKILQAQKKKAKPEKEQEKPKAKKNDFSMTALRKLLSSEKMDTNVAMKRFLHLSSSQNPPTDYSRPKTQIAG